MKAVQVVTLTGPSDVEVREVPEPTPAAHDVLVEVHSVGISFPDLLLSRGEYQFKPEPPFTLGVDFAGVVLDPGAPESSGFTVGQRVAGVNLQGGAAEQVANPVIFTFALPDTLSYDEGAALPMNYLTALFALEERGNLREGETVLFHGSTASRLFRLCAAGTPVCFTVTLMDGLILARSAFESSMNYRSAMVLGHCNVLHGRAKELGLRLIGEHLMPERWAEIREPSAQELKAKTDYC